MRSKTALHLAAECGKKEIVEFLIMSGALVNKLDDRLRSPLHYAALNGHPEIVELLISQGGATIDLKDYGGATPLLLAVWQPCPDKEKQLEVIKKLLQYRADPTVTNDARPPKSALTIARQKSLLEIVKLLESYIKEPSPRAKP